MGRKESSKRKEGIGEGKKVPPRHASLVDYFWEPALRPRRLLRNRERARTGLKRHVLVTKVVLKGHCHEHNFKNSTAQKRVYTTGNLLTVVKFS